MCYEHWPDDLNLFKVAIIILVRFLFQTSEAGMMGQLQQQLQLFERHSLLEADGLLFYWHV